MPRGGGRDRLCPRARSGDRGRSARRFYRALSPRLGDHASGDLASARIARCAGGGAARPWRDRGAACRGVRGGGRGRVDRKSTRLNPVTNALLVLLLLLEKKNKYTYTYLHISL